MHLISFSIIFSLKVFCLFCSAPHPSLVEEVAGDSIRVAAQIQSMHFPVVPAFFKEALAPLFHQLTRRPTLLVPFSLALARIVSIY